MYKPLNKHKNTTCKSQFFMKNYFKPLFLLSFLFASYTSQAAIGGNFSLIDHNNNKYSLSASSNVKLIFFGFLNCPDVCPTTLSDVSNLLKKLEGLAKYIDPIFVTIDPSRDTPELMKNYLSFFDKRIIGLTGSQEQIEKVSNQYHVYYSYQDKEAGGDYTVNHTANMYFLDKNNNVEKIFIPGTPFTEFYKYINRYMLKDIKNLPLQ